MVATIHVCPMNAAGATVSATGARHLVSLVSPGTGIACAESVPPANHLVLTMNDIVEAREGMRLPDSGHVAELLAFARAWDRGSALVISCFAGISRSTAAAYIVAAALMPEENERALAWRLRALSPSATPNRLLVEIGDRLLARQGRMAAAIAEIGRGADAFEGTPFCLTLG